MLKWISMGTPGRLPWKSGCILSFLAALGFVVLVARFCVVQRTLYDGSSLVLLAADIYRSALPRTPELNEASWWQGAHSRRLCALSMYTHYAEEPFTAPAIVDSMDPVPLEERVAAYLHVCQEVYEGLPAGGRHRAALDALDPSPELVGVPNVTLPHIHGSYGAGDWAREVRMGREEEAARRADLSHLWKPMEALADYPDAWRLAEHGVRPVREDWINASEIPDAFLAGRVALFDATRLLPREWFNLSVAGIASIHGELADRIPAYFDHGASKGKAGIATLRQFAERMERASREPHDPTHSADFHRWSEAGDFVQLASGESCRLPAGLFWRVLNLLTLDVLRVVLCVTRVLNHRATINARRLSRLPRFDLLDSLGNPAWAERVQSLLWIGPGAWNWHYDEDDNLLMSLNGEMWVMVMANRSDTDVVAGGLRLVEMQKGEAKLQNPFSTKFMKAHAWWFRKFPFYFLRLRPGMGVTVPSRTMHTVLASDSNRILMNAFFAPKFMARERTEDTSWWRAGHQAEAYLALRSLKQASIGRLWDTRQLGGFFSGAKLEML